MRKTDNTLDFYDTNAEAYAAKTVSADVSDIRDMFIPFIPRGGRILDLGCGSGRDSFAFSRLGFSVIPADGSEEMCAQAERYTGLEVRKMGFSEMDYRNEFDGVWACSSLLHLNSRELPSVLRSVYAALKENGVFFACFKKGNDEGPGPDGRYFNNLTAEKLRNLLEDAGFRIMDIWENTASDGTVWVDSLSKKISV